MKLSPDEKLFLRCWVYDEIHYLEGQGPAKALQLKHHALPADLAIIIAAAMPDPAEQEAAGFGPPPSEPPIWPWPEDEIRQRIAAAHAFLADREGPRASSDSAQAN